MCEPTSNAEAVRVDVAHERGNGKETTNVSSTVEYWQSALQEFCKNSPTPPPPPPQHAYVANPLTATPPAYGLWSGQIPPVRLFSCTSPKTVRDALQPLLTPYGPMPFFGGFFPGAYPIHPAATVPTVSLPAVKPEMHEDGEKGTQRSDLQTPKRVRRCDLVTPDDVSALYVSRGRRQRRPRRRRRHHHQHTSFLHSPIHRLS